MTNQYFVLAVNYKHQHKLPVTTSDQDNRIKHNHIQVLTPKFCHGSLQKLAT